MPFSFSVVIPVFNRERELPQALESIMRQAPDLEVVIVDDCSSDSSLQVAEAYRVRLPNLKILSHNRNLGVGPARNTGAGSVQNEWVAFLDSDDELVLGGVQIIEDAILEYAKAADGLWFRCLKDDGSLSPDLPFTGLMGYEDYLKFLEKTAGKNRDMLKCCRVTTFQTTAYPDSRSLEDLYHLDFAKEFVSAFIPSVVRLYHQGASNQLVETVARINVADTTFLRDMQKTLTAVLMKHGALLKRKAPSVYRGYLERLLRIQVNLGRRRDAFSTLLRLIKDNSLSMATGTFFALGVINPTLLGRLRRQLSKA